MVLSWVVSYISKAAKTNHSLQNIQFNKTKTIRIVFAIARNDRRAVVGSVRVKKFPIRNGRNHAKRVRIQI